VDISDDRRLLAAGSQDGAVCLWDVRTLEYLGVLGEHESAVEHLEFAPDGQMIVSRSNDSVVMGWVVSEDSLAQRRDSATPLPLQTEGVWIPFSLKNEASVDIRISDFFGQTVRRLSLGYQAAETILGRPRRIYWDLRDSSGVSVPGVDYQVQVTNGSHTKQYTIRHEHGTFRLP
jgi:WD40 repeat protein